MEADADSCCVSEPEVRAMVSGGSERVDVAGES